MYVLKSCFVKLCLETLAVSKHTFQSIQIVNSGNGQICCVPVCSAGGVAVRSVPLNSFSVHLFIQTDSCSCFVIHHSRSGILLLATALSKLAI